MQLQDILLVDDDPDDLGIIQEALQAAHGTGNMRYAQNGEAALSMLHASAIQHMLPLLIVLDLNMPKLNGTETLKILKEDERFSQIPVVIYSTSVNPLEKAKCMALGAHAYIIKPISFAQSMEIATLLLTFIKDRHQS